MCNVIIEKDAIIDLKDKLIKEYANAKVGLIISNKDMIKYKKFLQPFKNLPFPMEVYFFDFEKCNDIIIKEYVERVFECKYVIGVGVSAIIDITKAVASCLNIKYSILPTIVVYDNIISNNYRCHTEENLMEYMECNAPECVYVDTCIIESSSKNDIANAFAGVLSANIMVCKMLYDGEEDVKIEELNNILKQLNMFTNENIISNIGKQKLFKLILEIELFLYKQKIVNSISNIVSIYSKFHDNNGLKINEHSLIFSLLLLSIHEKILSNKLGMMAINIDKRINRLKTLFRNDKYVDNILNKIDNGISSEVLNMFASRKSYYLNNISNLLNRVVNNIPMLKRIYIDKGVKYKSVDINLYIDSLSVACDICDEKYLRVPMELGVLDYI